jgi:hypothetical protein
MALIPKSGAWIMIRQTIPVEYPIDPFSFFYAIPTGQYYWKGESGMGWPRIDYGDDNPIQLMHSLRMNDFDYFKDMVYTCIRRRKGEDVESQKYINTINGWFEDGIIEEDDLEQQVKIKTAFGDVCIQPHEYSVVKDMEPYMEAVKDGEGFIRYLSNSVALKGKIADQIFYLRTRGISYSDAMKMVVKNISSPNLFYLERHPELQGSFTRNWENYWQKKLNYCKEKNRKDLLNYGPAWDFSEVA